jgi:MFS family permease
MFCSLEITNALYWVTFSPISDITQHFFGSNSYYSSITGVNMLANIFLIFYLPGTLLCVFLKKRLKLKKTFLVGGSLTVAGGFLRYIAMLSKDSLGSSTTYWIVFLGQALAALAQPIFMNMPPAVASIWFPVKERDIATTIGSMCSPIGNAIGQIFPILFVTEYSNDALDDDHYDIKGMEDLMLVELILTAIPLVIVFFAFRDEPPTPPSHSTKLKQKVKQSLSLQYMVYAINIISKYHRASRRSL